ncbi:class I SAM-dependent methyltransferase [Ferruginibacter sp. SUN106]|uniref:class I SAM-dependent methyltransferase n=1 Tax=Ferruginibacter sp. SUN106 TaxID=2978348 RepID=UPI003D36492F
MNETSYQQLAAQLRRPTGEAGIQTGEWMNRGNTQINMDTLAILNAMAGDTILEIGMGNGFFVQHILQIDDSIQYTGADFSDVMVKEAERINAVWVDKGRADFILSDVAALPFAAAAFNKIFTINTIYFWDDAVTILSEIKRVLQPGGKFIVTLRPRRQMINYPFTKYGFHMFSKEEAEQLLIQNGFTILQSTELQEPDFELNGQMVKMESLVIEAVKK